MVCSHINLYHDVILMAILSCDCISSNKKHLCDRQTECGLVTVMNFSVFAPCLIYNGLSFFASYVTKFL